LIKEYISPAIATVLIAFSLYLFYVGIALMMAKDVASSLLAVLIGFVTLGGGITLLRAWTLARAYTLKKGGE